MPANKYLKVFALILVLFAVSTSSAYAANLTLNSIFSRFNWPTNNRPPFPKQSPTPTTKITQTPTPTKSASPTPSSSPTPTQQINIPEYLLKEVNNYRKSQGLSEVSSEKYTCDFADIRAREISTSFNHNGFRGRINSKSLPYPDYSKVTENIAMNSNYTKVVPDWINSAGHAENMRADTPKVCIFKYGNYYAYEGWRP